MRTLLRGKRLVIDIAFVCLFLMAGQSYDWFQIPVFGLSNSQPGLYKIDHFIDGNTIAVDMNGKVESIRFIGVDSPETHKPNTPVQCYGPDAAADTKQAIDTRRVRLVSDTFSTDRDRYGRLLRYVYLPDGTDLDEKLTQTGHGFAYVYFPFSNTQKFLADEKQA